MRAVKLFKCHRYDVPAAISPTRSQDPDRGGGAEGNDQDGSTDEAAATPQQ